MAQDRKGPLAVVVSIGLIGILVLRADWAGIGRVLINAEAIWILVAAAAFNLSQICGALRWREIALRLEAMPLGVSRRFAIFVTFSALWYANFLPSAFGGDAVRISQTWRQGGRMLRAVTASLLDRYLGLAGLLVVLAACLPFADVTAELRWALYAVITGFFSISIVLGRLRRLPLLASRHVNRTVIRLGAAVKRAISDRPAMWRQVIFTGLSTLLGFAVYWCSARATGVYISPELLVIVASVAILASILPISLAGWGVRESALVSMLEHFCGIDPSLAALATGVNAIAILSGGVIGLSLQFQYRTTMSPNRILDKPEN